MNTIPRDKSVDSTLALLTDGYTFIQKRCRRYRSDIFETRLLLQRTVCMRGVDAAELFYDPERFERGGAAPKRIVKTLFGRGGVQGLDGETHRLRKTMFMSLMTPGGIRRLADHTAELWNAAAERWERMSQVVLFDELNRILLRAVCRWTGVPLQESETDRRTGEMAAMIDAPGAVGPRYLQGRMGRKGAERWLGGIVRQVRNGRITAPEGSALRTMAFYRDPDGRPLDEATAAVELLNVIRPTVAVSRFIVFAALALHEHPECGEPVRTGDEEYTGLFVQEVRRFYPFFPFVAARVRRDFTWKGHRFPAHRRALLDLYGTDHDERIWDRPEDFRPERFRGWSGSAFAFIPQGGGDHYRNHRCPGEWITIELMKVGLRELTRSMSYRVPEQDLRISLSRIPAIPKSHFIISDIRRIA